jgi:hypothetical protein
MENIRYNLDSLEVSYGNNVLNSVTLLNERLIDLREGTLKQLNELDNFQRVEISDRVFKLIKLNQAIQAELQNQIALLNGLEAKLLIEQS